MTECCIETISNRQEGSLEELKLTPHCCFYALCRGSTISTIGQIPQPPGKSSPGLTALLKPRIAAITVALALLSLFHFVYTPSTKLTHTPSILAGSLGISFCLKFSFNSGIHLKKLCTPTLLPKFCCDTELSFRRISLLSNITELSHVGFSTFLCLPALKVY